MFVNCSNHPSSNWGQKQCRAAQEYGEIIDFPFPAVDAEASEQEVMQLAKDTARQILAFSPDVVMCQGEFTLTFTLVQLLKQEGILVLSACSNRKVTEEKSKDNLCKKTVVFEFVKFRKY